MSGFIKIAAGIYHDPKLLDIDAELYESACLLHVFAIGWSFENMTDGFIPRSALRVLLIRRAEEAAEELVRVGVWSASDKGWNIVKYADWQLTNEVRQRLSEAGKKRHQLGDSAKAQPRLSRGSAEAQPALSHGSAYPSASKSKSKSKSKKEEHTPRQGAAERDYSNEFDEFWRLYPCRISKSGLKTKGSKSYAFTAWKKAIKEASPDEIIAALKRYPFDDAAYVPDASRWLNKQAYLDEVVDKDDYDPWEGLE